MKYKKFLRPSCWEMDLDIKPWGLFMCTMKFEIQSSHFVETANYAFTCTLMWSDISTHCRTTTWQILLGYVRITYSLRPFWSWNTRLSWKFQRFRIGIQASERNYKVEDYYSHFRTLAGFILCKLLILVQFPSFSHLVLITMKILEVILKRFLGHVSRLFLQALLLRWCRPLGEWGSWFKNWSCRLCLALHFKV